MWSDRTQGELKGVRVGQFPRDEMYGEGSHRSKIKWKGKDWGEVVDKWSLN